jgi:beta-glucanase (GH16 family)
MREISHTLIIATILLGTFSTQAQASHGFSFDFDNPVEADAHLKKSNHSFPCNLTQFNPQNVLFTPSHAGEPGRMDLKIDNNPSADRSYSGAEVEILPQRDESFTYGRYAVRMKTSCMSGVVSAIFLFRSNPWQEIDIEILGKDPRFIQTSIVYNPGHIGDANNEPNYTPVLFDLGFNSCQSFHDYVMEWTDKAVRWSVDGRAIDERLDVPGAVSRVPNLPMSYRLNAWLSCGENWAGPLDPRNLPTSVQYEKVSYQVIH